MFRFPFLPSLNDFKDKSPEMVLKRSVSLLDDDAINNLKEFTRKQQTSSGGFSDRGGKPDLYYTLFGYFVAETLDLPEMLPAIRTFVESEIINGDPKGVQIHCAAILCSKLSSEKDIQKHIREKVREDLEINFRGQQGYYSFLHLLTCYYLKDATSFFRLGRKIRSVKDIQSLPCTVLAALLVLRKTFNRPVSDLSEAILSFYADGSFSATRSAPPDLLSTAVALYSLRFAGYDLRMIKPDSLVYVDSLFDEGGFCGSLLDPDRDIEYTFYGLLSLGSLSD